MKDFIPEYDKQRNTEQTIEAVYTHMRANVRDSMKEAIHIVHGYMIYECQDCKKRIKMYLERGLEDAPYDKEFGGHTPVPFGIVCPYCVRDMVGKIESDIFNYKKDVKGMHCFHVDFGVGESDSYEVLPEGESFFWNYEGSDCGIPVHPMINDPIQKMKPPVPKKDPFVGFIFGPVKGRMVGSRKSRKIVGKKKK